MIKKGRYYKTIFLVRFAIEVNIIWILMNLEPKHLLREYLSMFVYSKSDV